MPSFINIKKKLLYMSRYIFWCNDRNSTQTCLGKKVIDHFSWPNCNGEEYATFWGILQLGDLTTDRILSPSHMPSISMSIPFLQRLPSHGWNNGFWWLPTYSGTQRGPSAGFHLKNYRNIGLTRCDLEQCNVTRRVGSIKKKCVFCPAILW